MLALLLTASLAHAKIPQNDWQIQSGKLTYHVSFPLKKVDGVSENVKGKGHCAESACQFLVAAPVKSFQSGDGNRDNHMLEVTKAALHPMVSVKVDFPNADPVDARAEVELAGKTHVYEHIKLNPAINGTEAKTSGRVPMKLSDFGVERPSLLTVKIDDEVPVDFELTWAAAK